MAGTKWTLFCRWHFKSLFLKENIGALIWISPKFVSKSPFGYVIIASGNGLPFNSLAPGGFENIFQNVFFKLISWIDTLSNSCETALRSMPQNPSDDKSTLVQVMAWCRQAASHYLSQCCPRSLSPYGVTRPQWVNWSNFDQDIWHYNGDNILNTMILCSSLGNSKNSYTCIYTIHLQLMTSIIHVHVDII